MYLSFSLKKLGNTDTNKKHIFLEKIKLLINKKCLEFKKFNEQDIKRFLDDGSMIITVVNSKIFSEKNRPKNEQHIILIKDANKYQFIFSKGQKSIEKTMQAIYAAKVPSILVI